MKDQAVQKQRSVFLDMLKMVCVIMVIITHVSWSQRERASFIFPFIIDMAVPVFMIISGYLRAKKIEKIGFKKFISIRTSLLSFGNLMIAYVMVAIVEIIAAILSYRFHLGLDYSYILSSKIFFKWLFTGLSGPGSYYMPVMVQLIIFYPLIWFLVKKFKSMGLITCFAMNLAYEIMVYQCSMDPSLYRLLIFRYTFLIALGVYFAMAKGTRGDDIIALILLIAGILFITINAYIKPFTLFQDWKSTSMLCVPLAYGVIYFLKKYFGDVKYNGIFIIGKASLHIYLTQMVFFALGGGRRLNTLFKSLPSLLNGVLSSVIVVLVCVIVGIIFFKIESKVREWLFKKRARA